MSQSKNDPKDILYYPRLWEFMAEMCPVINVNYFQQPYTKQNDCYKIHITRNLFFKYVLPITTSILHNFLRTSASLCILKSEMIIMYNLLFDIISILIKLITNK